MPKIKQSSIYSFCFAIFSNCPSSASHHAAVTSATYSGRSCVDANRPAGRHLRQVAIYVSGNYNFFNMLTALLACSCLCDDDLPQIFKSFASAAIQRPCLHHVSSPQPATTPSRLSLLLRLLSPLLPPLLFSYMFIIVPSSPDQVRITQAQLSPPPSLQPAYSLLTAWTVQFLAFSSTMFHTQAAAALTAYVALSLLSAAAATSREVCDPDPLPSSMNEVKESEGLPNVSAAETSLSSRMRRTVIIVSSILSLIISSSLLLIIITPFSWTVALPLIPKDALQLHTITAAARISSSYGTPKFTTSLSRLKPTLFQGCFVP